jgi:hypothetical protein
VGDEEQDGALAHAAAERNLMFLALRDQGVALPVSAECLAWQPLVFTRILCMDLAGQRAFQMHAYIVDGECAFQMYVYIVNGEYRCAALNWRTVAVFLVLMHCLRTWRSSRSTGFQSSS